MKFIGISDTAVDQITACSTVRTTSAVLTIDIQKSESVQAFEDLQNLAAYDGEIFTITLKHLADYLVHDCGAAGKDFTNPKSVVNVTNITWMAYTTYYVDYMPRQGWETLPSDAIHDAGRLVIQISVSLQPQDLK